MYTGITVAVLNPIVIVLRGESSFTGASRLLSNKEINSDGKDFSYQMIPARNAPAYLNQSD